MLANACAGYGYAGGDGDYSSVTSSPKLPAENASQPVIYLKSLEIPRR